MKKEEQFRFTFKKFLTLGIFLLLFLALFLFYNSVFGVKNVDATASNVCCEKTVAGAVCQNAPPSSCDTSNDLKTAPTSCDATSFCKLGTCIDGSEGTCLPNTPQSGCQKSGGTWKSETPAQLPECKLGCCVIGSQAAFVSQAGCRALSSQYNLNMTYDSSITNEVECLATAGGTKKGACVYKKGTENDCSITTKATCTKGTFYSGDLCTDPSLHTICTKTTKTTCVTGKDGVYFTDSCGNLANIYDSSKANDQDYWNKIQDPTCGDGKDSPTCGACSFYTGSTCKAYKRGDSVRPKLGDNICKSLDCSYEGKKYKHGESWCGTNAKSSSLSDSPGARDFVYTCMNNQVTVQPCASYRQQSCFQNNTDGFTSAVCKQNEWPSCFGPKNKRACESAGDGYSCKWVNYGSGITLGGKCVPKIAPGFDSTSSEPTENGKSFCSSASYRVPVVFKKHFFGGSSCVKNCEYLDYSTFEQSQNYCFALGDCVTSASSKFPGSMKTKRNYIGVSGELFR